MVRVLGREPPSQWSTIISTIPSTRTYSTSRIQEILHKPKLIPDHLSPTHSNLLTISLSDHIPSECLPEQQPTLSSGGTPPPPSSPPPYLPQGHHLVYFPIQARPSELHADGTDSDHWPGPPFTRRMWAGGEVCFRPGWERAMRLDGRKVVCTETVEDVRVSPGRGEQARAFVDVWRRYRLADQKDEVPAAIEERRTLVFMPESVNSDETALPTSRKRGLKPPRDNPDYAFTLTPTRALLANYSALTYNAHSIHLDTHLTRAEGHPGLLVHGPLSLTLMFAALKGRLSQGQGQGQEQGQVPTEGVRWLGYRNLAPLYCDEEMRVCLREKEKEASGEHGERKWDVWVEGENGGLAVKGTATTGLMS
ncbi:hypothetical protein SODALDRAFT_333091 [Sodiomyces alkalinus F11]|uniref:Thioesterase/thiol ester dehydrase-isomerase n=1 Tax=Sodiomyces alkalinus (strain CBS 110278 / VKM F-3762 / F11) TaxID=1314773 RepID=A0A3N2PVH4_SODAK|nr:hypothetical protein SODALDRAFT_333091 [Sodiomyces alkalinus F11]ROT38495.1 hypothetical protein SODALDRAFT_333091 [Sodiomyces alkalinus F11]